MSTADLDALLRDLGAGGETPRSVDLSASGRGTAAPRASGRSEVDDLLSLTEDVPMTRGAGAPALPPPAAARAVPLASTPPASDKCAYVVLGPAACAVGAARTLVAPRRACPSLRCLGCDFNVLQFRGDVAWLPSVDYLFLRNVYPSPSKLCARLAPTPGGAAYCCQCSWVSLLPADGADVIVRRPGGAVPVAAGGGEGVSSIVRAGRAGGQAWSQWVCGGGHRDGD